MALLYYASSIPQDDLDEALFLGVPDYVLHAAAYAGLSLLVYLALTRNWRVGRRSAVWLSWSISLLYGVSDEYHQSFVAGRDPSVSDVAADGIGAGLMLLIVSVGILKRHGRLKE